MKKSIVFALTLCVAILPMGAALAQSPSATPFDVTRGVPALVYQSPMAGFVPLTETAVSPAATWREVNLAVGSYDSMSATMDAMPGMAMPAAQEMKSMPKDHDMSSIPMKHDMKSMPMKHDMTSMPMKYGMKAIPKGRDMQSMPMGHDMKSMPKEHDMKPAAKAHDMKSMPAHSEKMPAMDDMPGMKGMK